MQIFDNDVDTSDPNAQYWKEDLKPNVEKCFDISEPNFQNQQADIAQNVYDIMSADWEYQGGKLCMKKFKSHCRGILKRFRHKLHHYWRSVCQEDPNKPGPDYVNPLQWAKLVDYYTSPAMLNKSARMKKMRSCVTNMSRFGRGLLQLQRSG